MRFACPGVAQEERTGTRRATELVRFLGLEQVAQQRVSELPFGTRKRVELGRALASEPSLLLLGRARGGASTMKRSARSGSRSAASADITHLTVLLVGTTWAW
jgi:branched-chain amino acid transport system ATP-binding protein